MAIKNKRRALPAKEARQVKVSKQAIVSSALDSAGKKNPASFGPSGVRPVPMIKVTKELVLPSNQMVVEKSVFDEIAAGGEANFSGHAGEYLVIHGGEARGVLKLSGGGTLESFSIFNEPMGFTVAKAESESEVDGEPVSEIEGEPEVSDELSLDTPIEGLPISELEELHFDIHMRWSTLILRAAIEKQRGKEMKRDFAQKIRDTTDIHARIVDALYFRGVKHPTPPDNGLDYMSNEFERFAAAQPKHFMPPSSGEAIPVAKKDVSELNPFTHVPPEDGTYRFSVQNHHAEYDFTTDLRLGYKPNELVIGWELHSSLFAHNHDHVRDLATARAVALNPESNKIDWTNGTWKKESIRANARQPHPWVWIDVQGATQKPDWESGFYPPGAGMDECGVYLMMDRGEFEFGIQGQKFHEYFLKGKLFNYRLTMTAVEEKDLEAYVSKEQDSYNLPPEDASGDAGRINWYEIWDAKKEALNRPAVLTKGGPMPQDGFSALPKAVRSQIPAEYAYWEKTGEEASALRDRLVAALANKNVEIDFDAPFKVKVEKRSLIGAAFAVQKWDVDGESHHEMRIDVGRDEHLVIKSSAMFGDNPQSVEVGGSDELDLIHVDGEMRPSHHLNREKKTTLSVSKIDYGSATVMSLDETFIRVALKGEQVSGTFDVHKQDGEWMMFPEGKAPEGTKPPENYVTILKYDDSNEAEERLITGVVMDPLEVDTQNDFTRAAAIKETAHAFLKRYNQSTKMGIQHTIFGSVGFDLVESYIAPMDMVIGDEKVTKGSWIMTVKVVSDSVWEAVKRGDLTGFSIGGTATIA